MSLGSGRSLWTEWRLMRCWYGLAIREWDHGRSTQELPGVGFRTEHPGAGLAARRAARRRPRFLPAGSHSPTGSLALPPTLRTGNAWSAAIRRDDDGRPLGLRVLRWRLFQSQDRSRVRTEPGVSSHGRQRPA